MLRITKNPLLVGLTRSFSTSAFSLSHIGKAAVYYPPDVSLVLLANKQTRETTIENFYQEPLQPVSSKSLTSRERRGQIGEHEATLVVKGPLGEQQVSLHPFVHLEIQKQPTEAGNKVLNVSVKDSRVKIQRDMWGTTRALINNAVVGVTDGFNLTIKLVGVGYRANLEDNDKKIGLKLGYSHPIAVPIPEGVKVSIPQPTRIILFGTSKQLLGQFAASIRAWRKPEPYNQKGVFVGDEQIKKKEGKKK